MCCQALNPEGFLQRPLAPILMLEDRAGENMKKAKTDKDQYKEEHMNVFLAYRLKWPPVITDSVEGCHIMTHGMVQRVMEIAYVCHIAYKKTALAHKARSVQFLDANNSLSHIL